MNIRPRNENAVKRHAGPRRETDADEQRPPGTGRTDGENGDMEEKEREPEQEDPQPLSDEEFAEYQKKQKRESGIFTTIIDFILDFFR